MILVRTSAPSLLKYPQRVQRAVRGPHSVRGSVTLWLLAVSLLKKTFPPPSLHREVHCCTPHTPTPRSASKTVPHPSKKLDRNAALIQTTTCVPAGASRRGAKGYNTCCSTAAAPTCLATSTYALDQVCSGRRLCRR